MPEARFDFENLKVYQGSLDYVDFVYRITKAFPKHEMFSLTDQFRRAVTSICLNIAEGSGGTKSEFTQYLKISRRRRESALLSVKYAIGNPINPI